MAMWAMAEVGLAPCQCFSPGGIHTVSPGADLVDRAAPGLHAAGPTRHVEGLAKRMGVPGGAGAGLEGDQCGADARRRRRLDDRILPHGSGEVIGRHAARRRRSGRRYVHDEDSFDSISVVARHDRAIQYPRSVFTGTPGRAGR